MDDRPLVLTPLNDIKNHTHPALEQQFNIIGLIQDPSIRPHQAETGQWFYPFKLADQSSPVPEIRALLFGREKHMLPPPQDMATGAYLFAYGAHTELIGGSERKWIISPPSAEVMVFDKDLVLKWHTCQYPEKYEIRPHLEALKAFIVEEAQRQAQGILPAGTGLRTIQPSLPRHHLGDLESMDVNRRDFQVIGKVLDMYHFNSKLQVRLWDGTGQTNYSLFGSPLDRNGRILPDFGRIMQVTLWKDIGQEFSDRVRVGDWVSMSGLILKRYLDDWELCSRDQHFAMKLLDPQSDEVKAALAEAEAMKTNLRLAPIPMPNIPSYGSGTTPSKITIPLAPSRTAPSPLNYEPAPGVPPALEHSSTRSYSPVSDFAHQEIHPQRNVNRKRDAPVEIPDDAEPGSRKRAAPRELLAAPNAEASSAPTFENQISTPHSSSMEPISSKPESTRVESFEEPALASISSSNITILATRVDAPITHVGRLQNKLAAVSPGDATAFKIRAYLTAIEPRPRSDNAADYLLPSCPSCYSIQGSPIKHDEGCAAPTSRTCIAFRLRLSDVDGYSITVQVSGRAAETFLGIGLGDHQSSDTINARVNRAMACLKQEIGKSADFFVLVEPECNGTRLYRLFGTLFSHIQY